MLGGETWITLGVAAFAVGAMAGGAAPGVKFGAVVEILAISLRPGPCALKATYVAGHIGDILSKDQRGKVGEVLHIDVPALIMAVIDQLPRDHTKVLPGDSRHTAVSLARPVCAVAARAGFEENPAVGRVDIRLEHGTIFIFGVGCSEGLRRQQQCAQRCRQNSKVGRYFHSRQCRVRMAARIYADSATGWRQQFRSGQARSTSLRPAVAARRIRTIRNVLECDIGTIPSRGSV